MIIEQVVIFAPDFKPTLGGVAEYTFQLAFHLNRLGLLDRVLTPLPQKNSFAFSVDAPPHDPSARNDKQLSVVQQKLEALLYLSQFRWLEFKNFLRLYATRHGSVVLINWVVSIYSHEVIKLCQAAGIPYGIILHGKDIIQSCQANPQLFKTACERARLIVFNSQATYNLLKEHVPDIRLAQYYILYPGIDPACLESQCSFPLAKLERRLGQNLRDRTIISTVARLDKRKGIDLAIQALQPILMANKKLLYVIAGEGAEGESLSSLIKKLGLHSHVILAGRVSEQEKCALLQASSIFMMPNRRLNGRDFEGFGISFLEASYFENVVIGGRNGGVIEAVKEGCSGFLVDTESNSVIEEIRALVQTLLRDPSQSIEMAARGRQYVLAQYQTSQLVQDFARYLQQPKSCGRATLWDEVI